MLIIRPRQRVDEGRAQNAHEAGQTNQIDAVNIEEGLHRALEFVSPGINLVIDGGGRNSRLFGEGKTWGGAVLESTSTISAGKSGARAAAISADIFEPRPEMRMAVRRARS